DLQVLREVPQLRDAETREGVDREVLTHLRHARGDRAGGGSAWSGARALGGGAVLDGRLGLFGGGLDVRDGRLGARGLTGLAAAAAARAAVAGSAPLSGPGSRHDFLL